MGCKVPPHELANRLSKLVNCSEGLSPSRKNGYVGAILFTNLSCYLDGAELQNLKWHSSQCRIIVHKIGGDRPTITIDVYWYVGEQEEKGHLFQWNRGTKAKF